MKGVMANELPNYWNAHWLAYRRHIGELWMTGKLSRTEYERLIGHRI